MDSQKAALLKRDFDRDGYVVVRGFLSPEEIAELWTEVERYKREVVPHLPATEHFYEEKGRPETLKYLKKISEYDAYFEEFSRSPRIVEVSSLLLDDDVVADNLSLFNKPPRLGEETPAHQDGFYFKLEPMEAVMLWLALDEVDEENGCIRYVPGSHKQGMRPHQSTQTLGFSQGISDYGTEADLRDEVAVTARPGDLIVHHCLTIHRADANRSERTRHAFGFVFYAARAKPSTEELENYDRELNKKLTEAGKL